ncbi:hypothetical protein [Stratiformator vulcanicus]|uniref:Lipoprotein n=1 Tax=Stratiformator vulcanicus TaxID=2527980 RepID=A0A517QVS6_9PLAN|nr:hypothetical protein [Stratiformator vulcanicus]QDT35755.1 hypothetical protein Pan189_01080 [Stratiformator vulcanicus]
MANCNSRICASIIRNFTIAVTFTFAFTGCDYLQSRWLSDAETDAKPEPDKPIAGVAEPSLQTPPPSDYSAEAAFFESLAAIEQNRVVSLFRAMSDGAGPSQLAEIDREKLSAVTDLARKAEVGGKVEGRLLDSVSLALKGVSLPIEHSEVFPETVGPFGKAELSDKYSTATDLLIADWQGEINRLTDAGMVLSPELAGRSRLSYPGVFDVREHFAAEAMSIADAFGVPLDLGRASQDQTVGRSISQPTALVTGTVPFAGEVTVELKAGTTPVVGRIYQVDEVEGASATAIFPGLSAADAGRLAAAAGEQGAAKFQPSGDGRFAIALAALPSHATTGTIELTVRPANLRPGLVKWVGTAGLPSDAKSRLDAFEKVASESLFEGKRGDSDAVARFSSLGDGTFSGRIVSDDSKREAALAVQPVSLFGDFFLKADETQLLYAGAGVPGQTNDYWFAIEGGLEDDSPFELVDRGPFSKTAEVSLSTGRSREGAEDLLFANEQVDAAKAEQWGRQLLAKMLTEQRLTTVMYLETPTGVSEAHCRTDISPLSETTAGFALKWMEVKSHYLGTYRTSNVGPQLVLEEKERFDPDGKRIPVPASDLIRIVLTLEADRYKAHFTGRWFQGERSGKSLIATQLPL